MQIIRFNSDAMIFFSFKWLFIYNIYLKLIVTSNVLIVRDETANDV